MIKRRALSINTLDCVGCKACEVACKQEHDIPPGPRWIRVKPAEIKEAAGKQRLNYALSYCRQCYQPACKGVCPSGAISQREDGIVLIDDKSCTGCRSCIAACPFEAMQFNEEKKVAEKCHLCAERAERGFKPACVAACPSHCIQFGE